MGVGFGILRTSGSGGGGGGTTITTVANYSALPPASGVSGKFYWCEASQGTKWLPFSMGGTYYPLGMYYSNGVTWEYSETPYQATLAEVNTGTNTDKFVSPYTFTNADKWGNYTLKTTTISTSSPLQGGGDLSANRTFSITQSNATTDGYLSSADWNTFNNKGNGTVTSVGLTMPSAFTVSNSPIISNGNISVTGAGTIAEYIRGDGTLATFPTLTGYVPYTGATTDVDLGTYNLTADHITLNTNPSGAGFVVGSTEWNNTDGTSETLLKGGNVILKNGVDLVARVVNNTGINLTKASYQVVKVSGAQGQRLAVDLAQANNDNNSADTLGVVAENINNNLEGFILTVGQLLNINTTGSLQGETWVDGDVVYLSPTIAGAMTNIKPNGSTGHIVVLGYVEYAHANNGKIYLKIMNGWELDELHNVYITNPQNKNLLSYVTPANLWENQTLGQVIGGVASQYVRGDGTIATFPTSTGGGSSVAYYLNGGTSQGTIGGNSYYEMSKTAVIGTGVDFSLTNTTGYIAEFITDANDPSLLSIPQGAWNFSFYFSASAVNNSGSFYVELYKYDGTTFTLISSSSSNPELITNGTAIDLYTTSTAVPLTTLTLTDRLAVRVFVNTNGAKTITLHTQDSHLCEIITTFSTGINTLNSLSTQVQYFTVGTSGTNFNISSVTDTHTFNLPTASATNRGALSSTDWSTFNGKQNALTIGNLTDVGTDGISVTGGTGAIIGSGVNISQQVASATQNGYLSSTDWVTFNSASPSFIPDLTVSSFPRGYYANNGSTTLSLWGNANAATVNGTAGAVSIASGTYLTQTIRMAVSTSSVAGSKGGVRSASLYHSVGQGFYFSVGWAIQDAAYVVGSKQFHGFLPITTLGTLSNTIDNTSLINFVGVGSDATDTNLQVFYNDATGTASKVDLGANFPANRTAGAALNNFYVFEMYNAPLSTSVKYKITERTSGNTAQGTLTSDLPASTTLLGIQALRTNGVTALAQVTQWSHLVAYTL